MECLRRGEGTASDSLGSTFPIHLAQTMILGLRITQEFQVLLPPGKCSGARAMVGIDLI